MAFFGSQILRFKGKMANFEANDTIKHGKKRQKDKWFIFHACTLPPSHPRELETCPIRSISVRSVTGPIQSFSGGFWQVVECWVGSGRWSGREGFCKGKEYHYTEFSEKLTYANNMHTPSPKIPQGQSCFIALLHVNYGARRAIT